MSESGSWIYRKHNPWDTNLGCDCIGCLQFVANTVPCSPCSALGYITDGVAKVECIMCEGCGRDSRPDCSRHFLPLKHQTTHITGLLADQLNNILRGAK